MGLALALARCLILLYTLAIFVVFCDGSPIQKRQDTCTGNGLQVDLGYAIYRGFDAGNGLNAWTKVRYAAPPIGALRWQAPRTPTTTRATVISATANPTTFACPQAFRPPVSQDTCGNLKDSNTVASTCNVKFLSEDCLFLNVYAPQNATNLPVLVWIHGGGYGQGNGGTPAASLVNSNNQRFILVTIQYRLGAFGFLSSSSVQSRGVSNAGFYDQQFALKWVQDNICQFGGDRSSVTIMGQSAGGGSVAAQISAMNGSLNNTYFRNSIAVSPYVPKPDSYQDPGPTSLFNAFALEVGCNKTATAFKCLQAKRSTVLQVANRRISASWLYGTWAFMPVVDGKFLVRSPIEQIATGNVNGERLLTGNVANEGAVFVPRNISSFSDFSLYAGRTYPNISLDEIVANYPSSTDPTDPSAPLFATAGDDGPTAINQSSLATGQQQRANNLYAEATFVCPSYWLADAFAQAGKASFKYQYSVPYASHADDLNSYFGPLVSNINTDFQLALMQMLGDFTVNNDPSISNVVANGVSLSNTTSNPASSWPQWTMSNRNMINFNVTGGTPSQQALFQPGFVTTRIPVDISPGLTNNFEVVDADTWEGGRGARCDFWRNQYSGGFG